jgi:hypothetical protein
MGKGLGRREVEVKFERACNLDLDCELTFEIRVRPEPEYCG